MGSHSTSDSHSKPYLHPDIQDLEQESVARCNPTNYEESSCSSLILVAFYDIPQRKAVYLSCTLKKPGRHGAPSVRHFTTEPRSIHYQ